MKVNHIYGDLSKQNDEKNWFEKITAILERNIKGVQLGIYTVAFCGLGIALRSVRPFKKFSSPNQIPKTFFEKNIKLNGKVLNIDVMMKPVLLVDHYPIFGSTLRSIGPPLSVEMEGINISHNGVSWLQTIANNENVEFTLLKKNDRSVSCIVLMKKRNIANHLVTLGFASVEPFNLELKSLEIYTKYYAELLRAEEVAEKKGAGIWVTDRSNGSAIINTFSKKILRPLLKTTLNRVQFPMLRSIKIT